jgi:hypothetical protein
VGSIFEYRNWALAGLFLSTLNGCGDPDSGSAGAAGSGGMSAAGASGAAIAGNASGGTSSGGGGGGAMAGSSSAGSATAGTSPVGAGECSGTFGKAVPVMIEDTGFQMNGISLTADELELYYARSENGSPAFLVRRQRASKMEMFGMVEALPELVGVCGNNQRLNPDVSDDGLTLYVTCTNIVDIGMSEGVSQLRVAHRADRDSAFTLAAEPIGGVYASAGISADELTAYSDGEIFNTAPQMFTRAAKTEMFGEAQPVPGVDAPLNSPDISSDGLALFGSATPPGATVNAIHRAVRTSKDADFGPLQALDLQLPATSAVGAPNITPDCSLYLIVVLPSIGHTMHQAIVP